MSRTGPSNRKMRRHGARAQRKGGGAPSREAIQTLVGLCRAGRHREACESAQAFTRRWPEQAVGWTALAMAREGLGEPAAAVEAYRRALQRQPENVEARNNMGNALRASGAPQAAVEAYRQVLAECPEHVEARFNLALALEDQGALAEAESACRDALERRPGFADAATALGRILHAAGRDDEAEAVLRRALAQRPRHAGLLSALAVGFAARGQVDEAERCYRDALAAEPGSVELRLNLAGFLQRQERLVEAEAECCRVLQSAPESAVGHHTLACVLAARNRLAAARAADERALEIDPAMAPAWHHLGDVLMDLGALDEAEAAHRKAAELQPQSADAWRNLGIACAVMGRRAAAEAALRRALELRPDHGEAWYQLAVGKRFTADDSDLATIEGLLARADLACDDRVWLHFAAGKAVDDGGGDPARMFAHCEAANRIRRGQLDYDIAADEADLAAIAAAFDGARVAGEGGEDTAAPVFIVGMWRSGTTLVEQVLASHPGIHGAGERHELGALVAARDRAEGAPFPAWVERLDAAGRQRLGAAYREWVIDPTGSDVGRVTDKRPDNFRYLGLIAGILPRARIIHVRRNPLDTCLSCFTRPLSAQMPYAFDLAELGRYYRAYAGLMAHWQRVLPTGMLLEVDYEALIDDAAGEARRLVDHVGLDWDPACLEFHRTQRAVVTASLAQVREPIYRSAMERWRPYADHLGPLIKALGPLAGVGDVWR